MEMKESRNVGEGKHEMTEVGLESAVVADSAGERRKLDESWSKRERGVSDWRAWEKDEDDTVVCCEELPSDALLLLRPATAGAVEIFEEAAAPRAWWPPGAWWWWWSVISDVI